MAYLQNCPPAPPTCTSTRVDQLFVPAVPIAPLLPIWIFPSTIAFGAVIVTLLSRQRFPIA